MSNGSSGRPSRFSISRPTAANCGEVSTCSNIALTRSSLICRSSSNFRAISVGAVGEYGSTFRFARKTASNLA